MYPNDWFDYILYGILGFCIIFVLVVLSGVAYIVYNEYKYPCIRYEKQLVHHNAWTQTIFVGKGTIIPIYHPAYDNIEDVCIERTIR